MNNLESAVRDALATVRDPELDEDLVSLGFVDGVSVRERTARVRLRLPTYFCAPNFAWLMVADAREAVEALPGVARAEVELVDHFAAEQINQGVAAAAGFATAFPGMAEGELDDLRLQFRRKTFLARQERLCRTLLRTGLPAEQLAAVRLADLPDDPETRTYRARRAELGFDMDPDAPFLVDTDGRPVDAGATVQRLRLWRTARVSVEGNAAFCRSVLTTRYGPNEEA